MPNPFCVDAALVGRLSSTRQGRVSLGGFNYQMAFGIARLAAMHTRHALLNVTEVPVALRYDWAEDIEEVDSLGHVVFTQCKRVEDFGEPALLALQLACFAPKWLWMPSSKRSEVRFRIVCTDKRFANLSPTSLASTESNTRRLRILSKLRSVLTSTSSPKSDRALWQMDADAVGHDVLANALWNSTDILFVSDTVMKEDPAGALFMSERAALDLLLRHQKIDPSKQAAALQSLRTLIHGNLVAFDSQSLQIVPPIFRTPQVIELPDVHAALLPDSIPVNHYLPFLVVDRAFHRKQANLPKQILVARSPEWADVVHGSDKDIRLIERSQTSELIELTREKLLRTLARGSDRKLHALFVLGPPGAGKSTLVRRVAALLVQACHAVVVDPGLNLDSIDPSEFDSFVEELDALAAASRPVLLVLDDPLFHGSGWADLLRRLGRPQHQIAIISACPDFLWDRFGPSLSGKQIKCHTFSIEPPSPQERREIATVYGRDPEHFLASDEDFLGLTMEAASGEDFTSIIDRMWTTLNDGSPINEFEPLADLPWPVRALLFVAYFHRAHVPCPLSVLKEALMMSGRESPADLDHSLAYLKMKEGWHIFRLKRPRKDRWGFNQALSCAHQRVANEAWQRRPFRFLDVGDIIARASVSAQSGAWLVGSLVTQLLNYETAEASSLIEQLAFQWNCGASDGRIEARNLWSLTSVLARAGKNVEASMFMPGLRTLSTKLDAQSWLAAMQMRYLSESDPAARVFPEGLNITDVIDAADFSIAPARAYGFANSLTPGSPAWHAFKGRLLGALTGSTNWRLDSHLLVWLMSKAPESLSCYLDHLRSWLDNNIDDCHTRTKYLHLLHQLHHEDLPSELESTLQWLNGAERRHQAAATIFSLVVRHRRWELVPRCIEFGRKCLTANHGKRNVEAVATSILSLVRALPRMTDAIAIGGIVNKIELINMTIRDWYESTGRPIPPSPPKTKVKSASLPAEDFIRAVDQLLPQQPWKIGVHISIATQLCSTRSQVRAAIAELIRRGSRLRQRDGIVFDRSGKVVAVDQERMKAGDLIAGK